MLKDNELFTIKSQINQHSKWGMVPGDQFWDYCHGTLPCCLVTSSWTIVMVPCHVAWWPVLGLLSWYPVMLPGDQYWDYCHGTLSCCLVTSYGTIVMVPCHVAWWPVHGLLSWYPVMLPGDQFWDYCHGTLSYIQGSITHLKIRHSWI